MSFWLFYKLHHAKTLLLKLLTKVRFPPDHPALLRYSQSCSDVLKPDPHLLLDESLICISLGHMSVSWQPVFTCNLKLFYHCQSYTCRGYTFVCFQVCVLVCNIFSLSGF